MPKNILLITALILSIELYAQKNGIFNPVKIWVITHPFAAHKIKIINQLCQPYYNQKDLKHRLDSFNNGGKLDAFRHAFFMAAFNQKVRVKALRKLGKAHENQNYRQFCKGETNNDWRHDSLSMVMDLYNNEMAFALFEDYSKISLETLKEQVIQIILGGKTLIMKRNRKGELLSCDGYVLNKSDINNGWYVPKCLVNSDYVYKD